MAESARDQIDGVKFQLAEVGEQVDGVKEQMHKLEEFLRKSLEWARYLMAFFLVSVLVIVLVYNAFAPKEKDVPDHVIEALRKGLNLATLIDNGGIVGGFPFPISNLIASSIPSATTTQNTTWKTG